MVGVMRVRSIGARRFRAGLLFTREPTVLDGAEINEVQFLSILKDPELLLEKADDADKPEWVRVSDEERAIAAEELGNFIEFQSA